MLGRVHLALCAALAVLAVAACCVILGTDPGRTDAAVNSQAALEPDDVAFVDAPFDDAYALVDPYGNPYYVDQAPVPETEVLTEVTAAPASAPDAVQTAPAATGPVRGDSMTVRSGTAQSRGQAALDSLPFAWRELGVTVSFREYTGSVLGLYYPRSKRVVIYVKRTQSTQGLRVTIAHELGHALDALVNTPATRKAYLAARGISTRTPWLPCISCSDYASGAGDFAEVFAFATAGPGDFRSRLAGAPGSAQLAALRTFFRSPSQREPVSVAVAAPTRAPAPVTTTAPTTAPIKPVVPTPAPTKKVCGVIDSLLGGCKS